MNWFSENKIFSSILVVLVLGVLALGYLTFSESGKYNEAATTYQSSMEKLTQQRGLAPYRNAENLKKIQDQVANYKGLTDDLRAELLKRQGAIALMEPAVFQARLRESVSKTVAHATQRGVELPPKFYLGFEKYENELPRNDVTGLLNWQLNAVESIVNRLIDLKVSKIDSILRAPLPGEINVEPLSKEIPLLKKYPFEIGFLGYPGNLQAILNDLDSLPEFTVTRAVRTQNEVLKGPAKTGALTPTTDPTAIPKIAVDEIIIGKEKITANIIIDLVQFTTPQPPKK